ncbi:MAG: hypothetical protein ABFC67_01750 [Mizugakiibacter sp.]|uniref:hypothetical protein n=1 Tax=Mizugakiibacter sp. TaxID=1972610 RepID=UPI0031C4524C|nr:hypothetical protein [Xanthomonadaceae bacterium]
MPMTARTALSTLLAAAAIALAAAPAAHAEKFSIKQKVQQEHGMDLPKRGMTMAEVEKRYGAPLKKLPSAGGDAPKHPPINRWDYPGYTVYFERDRVIHSVVDTPASPAPAASSP